MEIIKGKVKKGRGLGRQLGFPTLNIEYTGETEGIFAARVKIGDERFIAAVHVGPRPTIDDPKKICEVFILDASDVKEVEEVEVELVKKIREIEKFETLELLTAQITKDVEDVRNLLK